MKQTNDERVIREVAGGSNLPASVETNVEHTIEAMRRAVARNDGGVNGATGLPRAQDATLSWAGGTHLLTNAMPQEPRFDERLQNVAGVGGETSAVKWEPRSNVRPDDNHNTRPALGEGQASGVNEIVNRER